MPRPTTLAEFLIAPPRTVTGVLALLSFGILGNVLAGLSGLAAGSSVWLLALWVPSIGLLLVALWLLTVLRRRATPRVLVPDDQRPVKHRGLIVLVGTGRPKEDPLVQSAASAIDYHRSIEPNVGLQCCWLIATAGENGSVPVADALKQRYQGQNLTVHIRVVADPFQIQETYNLVQRIYTEEVPRAGLAEHEVIADFTGGVKPMSAGMILACGERRPMQYMFGRKPGIASTPSLVSFVAETSG